MSGAALRVAVDAWNLPHDRRGIGRYVRAILRSWAQNFAERVTPTLIIPDWPVWLHAAKYRSAAEAGPIAVRHRDDVRPGRFDVAWFPWNGMSWTTEVAAVATLHDASLYALPSDDEAETRRHRAPFELAVARARRVITDSSFSRAELERYLGLAPAAVDVVHLGVEAPVSATPAAFDGLTRYALFVGEPEQRKGLDLLLAAAGRLPMGARDGLGLVLAGNGTAELSDEASSPRRIGLGAVSDARLASLYAGAAALVYPSRYEGFGLPVLEAMAAGTPVVASDAAAIREAGGDAALYFRSGDADELALALRMVLEEPVTRESLRARGQVRAALMSWDRTARETLAILEKTAAEP